MRSAVNGNDPRVLTLHLFMRFAVFALAASIAVITPFFKPTATASELRHLSTNPLVGSWKLISLETTDANGKLQQSNCTGQLIFSESGNVSIQVMYLGKQQGDQYARGGYEATFGTYSLVPNEQVFSYHIQGSLVRSLVKKTVLRKFALTGDQMVIASTNPADHFRVTWKRD